MEETFTKIYATDAWGKGSGAGSVPVHCLKWLLGATYAVPPGGSKHGIFGAKINRETCYNELRFQGLYSTFE